MAKRANSNRKPKQAISYESHSNERFPTNPSHEPEEPSMFGDVPSETKNYLKSIETQIDSNSWNSDDELESFLFNVYEDVVGKELCLASDPDCSIVIEKLLHLSSSVHLRIFMDKLSGNFPHLLKHFCASHVVQTLIVLSARVLDDEARNVPQPRSPKDLPTMTDLVTSMCSQLTTFWTELASDKHASFVIRILLKILMGQTLPLSSLRSRSGRTWAERHSHPSNDPTHTSDVVYQVPSACSGALNAIVDELLKEMWPMIGSYAFDPIACPVIDQLFDAAPNVADLASQLLTEYHSDNLDQYKAHVRRLMTHPVASRLVEKALSCCPSVTILDFFKVHVHSNISDLCRHPIANHAIQALVRHTHNMGQLEIILESLYPQFKHLLFSGRPLIIVACIEAAQRFQILAKVLKHMYSACEPKTTSDLFPTLLFLNRTFPDPTNLSSWVSQDNSGQRSRIEVNRAGHQIVSLIFNMHENKELVDSILARKMDWYHPLLLDPIASYTFQTFFGSKTIGTVPKRKLINSIVNSTDVTLGRLAADKFGSHIVDVIWQVADLDLKSKLAQHLLIQAQQVQASHFGRLVWRNCRMETYKSKRNAWTANVKSLESRAKLFDDMLDSSETPVETPKTNIVVEDEIDLLFKQKKVKGPKTDEFVEYVGFQGQGKQDKSLQAVMGAIESTKKKRKRSDKSLSSESSTVKKQKNRSKPQYTS